MKRGKKKRKAHEEEEQEEEEKQPHIFRVPQAATAATAATNAREGESEREKPFARKALQPSVSLLSSPSPLLLSALHWTLHIATCDRFRLGCSRSAPSISFPHSISSCLASSHHFLTFFLLFILSVFSFLSSFFPSSFFPLLSPFFPRLYLTLSPFPSVFNFIYRSLSLPLSHSRFSLLFSY